MNTHVIFDVHHVVCLVGWCFPVRGEQKCYSILSTFFSIHLLKVSQGGVGGGGHDRSVWNVDFWIYIQRSRPCDVFCEERIRVALWNLLFYFCRSDTTAYEREISCGMLVFLCGWGPNVKTRLCGDAFLLTPRFLISTLRLAAGPCEPCRACAFGKRVEAVVVSRRNLARPRWQLSWDLPDKSENGAKANTSAQQECSTSFGISPEMF